jgi:lysophospholipase L1-like esterase
VTARTWRQLAALALLASLAGCSSGDDDNGNPNAPSPTPGTGAVSYTAVGASDAIGFGGTSVCVPFADCRNGTGYVQTVVRRLRESGREVTILNLGIPGAVLGPDIEGLARQLGRGSIGNFLERALPFVSRSSTLVTVFAGGNDANVVGSAIDAGLGGADPVGFGENYARGFGRDMRALVNGIRERAPDARIVVLNLPNLAGLPYVAARPVPQKQIFQALAVRFSAEINGVHGLASAVVVDLMCDPRSYVGGNYSGDGFHPNDSGYAFMADLVYAAATTGSSPTPRSSCPQMNLF